MNAETEAEALADFIATERDKYPRRADDMDSEELATAIIEWQASRPITDSMVQRLREALFAQSNGWFYPTIESAQAVLEAALGVHHD